MKHTPGPWEISTIDERTIGPITEHSDKSMRDVGILQMKAVASVEELASHDETDANARLLAAAPDLLSALENMVEANRSPLSELGQRARNEAIGEALAAIAKVRGNT